MRKLATIRRVDNIVPIEGADMIELAVVDGWKCVIRKNDYAVGDSVIYCEIDSFLPVREEFEFLRKSSFIKMGDEEGFRLRTVKLRGQISQGLLINPSVLGRSFEHAEDVTEELGIVKYEPPVPAELHGTVLGGFPSNVAKTDEERIQNLSDDFQSFAGKQFYVSEKLDGTSLTAFLDDEFGVCGRNWQYAEDTSNSYWQAVIALGLREKMEQLGRRLAIQGELIGPSIQNNRYALKQRELFVFNVFDIENYGYLDKDQMASVCESLGVKVVPFVESREVPETIDEVLNLAQGKSALHSKTEREGLVWVHGSGSDRISFKAISNKFLAKYGD